MKLARDMSGKELIKQLGKYGYTVTRQTGNHVRLTTNIISQKEKEKGKRIVETDFWQHDEKDT